MKKNFLAMILVLVGFSLFADKKSDQSLKKEMTEVVNSIAKKSWQVKKTIKSQTLVSENELSETIVMKVDFTVDNSKIWYHDRTLYFSELEIENIEIVNHRIITETDSLSFICKYGLNYIDVLDSLKIAELEAKEELSKKVIQYLKDQGYFQNYEIVFISSIFYDKI